MRCSYISRGKTIYIYIYIYPIACGVPATVPSTRSSDSRSSAESSGTVRQQSRPGQFVCRVVRDSLEANTQTQEARSKRRPRGPPGKRFGTPGGSFWQSRGVVLVPLVTIWATQGSPGDPMGDKTEKGCEKVVRGPSPGPPPGTHFDTFSEKIVKSHVGTVFVGSPSPVVFCSVLKRT